MAGRGGVFRLGGVVALLLGVFLLTASPIVASAASVTSRASVTSVALVASIPSIPGVPDCKDPPAAQLPGSGLPGFLDSTPDPLPTPGDPFAKNPTTSVYEQYGYAGLTWHTYDLGCGGDLRDVNATTDTMIGNAELAFATWGVAAANGLHNTIVRPAEYMAPLDDVVNAVSTRIKEAIWGPWGGAALLGVVVLLLWYSTAGRLSSVVRSAAWAVLVLGVMAGVAQYPARVSAFFDETVTGSISAVNGATAGLSSIPETSDPARARGGLLVDRLLYDSWLRGTFGSPDSAAAQRWGPDLFRASAYTWAEAQAARVPAKAKKAADEKATAWKQTAAQIQETDPNAYLALQGKVGDRAGVGVMAIFAVAFTSLFQITADLFVFAGLVMLRFLVMFFPAVAVLGVMAPMSAIVHRVANMAGACVINVIAFGAGAAIHTTVVAALLSRARLGGMNLLILVLCMVSTLVAFVLLFPLLSLTNIVGMSAGGRGVHALRGAGQLVSRYGTTRKGVADGTQDAELVGASSTDQRPGSAADPPSGGAGRLPFRRVTLPAESFGRPEQLSERQLSERHRTEQQSSGGHHPQRQLSGGQLTEGQLTERQPTERRDVPVEALAAHQSADQAQGVKGRGTSGRHHLLVPLEGVVVEHPPRPLPEANLAHDSETIIAADGVGPRLFDPATKSSVRTDSHGNEIRAGER